MRTQVFFIGCIGTAGLNMLMALVMGFNNDNNEVVEGRTNAVRHANSFHKHTQSRALVVWDGTGTWPRSQSPVHTAELVKQHVHILLPLQRPYDSCCVCASVCVCVQSSSETSSATDTPVKKEAEV